MASNLKKQVTNIYPKNNENRKTEYNCSKTVETEIKAAQENDLKVVSTLILTLEELFSSNELDLKTASSILNQLVTTRKNILSYNIVENSSGQNWINSMQIRDLHGKSI